MRALFLVFLTALAVTLAAQNLAYAPDANWHAPASAMAQSNPLTGRTDLVAGGRKLFERNCAHCHGSDGRGLKQAADLQLKVVQAQSDGTLHWKITNGNTRRGMPSFSGLPDAQRWQLVLFLRTLAQDASAGTAR